MLGAGLRSLGLRARWRPAVGGRGLTVDVESALARTDTVAARRRWVGARRPGGSHSGGIPRVHFVPRWMVHAHGRDRCECFPKAQRGANPAGRDSQRWMLDEHGGDCGDGIPRVHFALRWMVNAHGRDWYECFRKAQRGGTPARRDSRRWMLDKHGRDWYECFPEARRTDTPTRLSPQMLGVWLQSPGLGAIWLPAVSSGLVSSADGRVSSLRRY